VCEGTTSCKGILIDLPVIGTDMDAQVIFGAVPLGLEVDGFLIPVADGGRDGVHGHDALHEGGGDPGRVISDKNVFVVDEGHCYVVLKEGGVFCEGWGVFVSSSILSGFLDHSLDGEPGDGVGFNIVVFKCGFKVCDEDGEGPHGDGGSYKGVVPECGCPGQGRSFGHVGEGEGDFFCVGVVYFFIHCKVK